MKAPDWKGVAERLGEAVPRSCLHASVVERVGARDARRGSWILAVSGGADSVALLLLVWAHWPEARSRLCLAHFDHGLRGEQSTGDAQFCEHLAASLGLDFELGHWRGAPATVNEHQARQARHSFLKEVMRYRASRFLWTGHHQDDLLETMLMRLFRGSGGAGLAAPRPVHQHTWSHLVLRPLLSRERLFWEQQLRQAGGLWREDASNASSAHWRNRIRNEVLPVLRKTETTRDLGLGISLSRELLEEDETALEVWLASLQLHLPDGSLAVGQLLGLPRALLRRALHAWLGRLGYDGDLSRQGFQHLLALCERLEPARFDLGSLGCARLRRGLLYLEKPEHKQPK